MALLLFRAAFDCEFQAYFWISCKTKFRIFQMFDRITILKISKKCKCGPTRICSYRKNNLDDFSLNRLAATSCRARARGEAFL